MTMGMHRFEKQYNSAKIALWKSSLTKEDKESIELFLKDCKTRGVKYARLVKLCRTLIKMGSILETTYEKARMKAIKELVHHYVDGDYSEWARHDIKVIIKQYYAWLNKGKYPNHVAWINTTIKKQDKKLIYDGELLTRDEIDKAIEVCDHPRNKALLAVLAESGARIGEVGNLTIRQINLDPNGCVVTVQGKTGSRRLRLVTATPHLVTWLNNHPDRKNPYAPVWMNIGCKNYHREMGYGGIRKVIQNAFKKAEIKKRCNPHIFRHTRASQLAHYLTEFQMNTFFGWVQGSDMPALYVHISGKDLDEHMLKINGLKHSERPIYSKPKNRICPRCKQINGPDALYCAKCAEIVDPALALKIQMQTTEKPMQKVKTPFLEWLQKDPEMRDVLKRKADEFRGGDLKI
ncbi:tyrosine-type recombinase/integrase [Candidatus Woesearchaeota archaeon]|nr:tyrosine-type recombinase/integrase [Candidatus Woesearchaeota archaeon]